MTLQSCRGAIRGLSLLQRDFTRLAIANQLIGVPQTTVRTGFSSTPRPSLSTTPSKPRPLSTILSTPRPSLSTTPSKPRPLPTISNTPRLSSTMGDLEAWGEAGKRYQIHVETLSYFRKLQELGAKPYGTISPEEMRGQSLRRSEVFAGFTDFEGSERQILVPSESPGNPAGIPISVYKPSDCSRVAAILIYFHGGGLVACSRNTHSTTLKTIARRSRCIVVSVEYRLAPQHKVPAPFDDCRDVTRWILHNKVFIGGHADSCVGLGGDSCGGQLTASIAHDVIGLGFQILVYPLTDLSLAGKSYEEFADTPGLNTAGMKWFMSQFLSNDGQKTDPVVSPYHRPSFSGLPPTLCILAQLDPLRDDGIAYCDKLKKAGVPTDVLLVEGASHTFYTLPAHFQQLTKEPYRKTVEFIQQFQTE